MASVILGRPIGIGRRADARTLVHFAEARLVSLPNSAYVELGRPETNGPFSCAFCPKGTAHEHEFTGRIKFEPKDERYFISFINTGQTSKPGLSKRKAETETTSNIKLPGKVPVAKTNPAKGGNYYSKIYPLIVESETQCLSLIRDSLKSLLSDSSRATVVMAIKIPHLNTVQVLKAQKKPSLAAGRSLLKAKRLKPSECEECSKKDLPSMTALMTHMQTSHDLSVRVKKMNVGEDEPQQEHQEASSSIVMPGDGLPSVCTVCHVEFPSDAECIRHCNEVHATKDQAQFQCDLCLQKFAKKTIFRRHRKGHGKPVERNFVCQLCEKAFTKVQHLQDHVRTHLGVKLHACDQCDKRYTSSTALKSHKVYVHSEGPRPTCPDCTKTFYSSSHLNKHMLQFHDQDLRFCCPVCGQYYLRRPNLDAHVQSAHGDAAAKEKLTCRLCDAHFGNLVRLEGHQQNVHGVLPWNKVPPATQIQDDLDIDEDDPTDPSPDTSDQLNCRICEHYFLPAEMESHLRFSHGVVPIKADSSEPSTSNEYASVTEAAEALLRTLTPQPDYLLRCLTPLPLETLDDFLT